MILNLEFNEDKKILDLTFDNFQQIISHNVERYGGEYEIEPKVEQQVLQTNQKLMEDDLTILAIPYSEVSNDSDGYTVYIGKELS